MVPFWGRCTTHFSGDWDVHWGFPCLILLLTLSDFSNGAQRPQKGMNAASAKQACKLAPARKRNFGAGSHESRQNHVSGWGKNEFLQK